MNQKRMRYIEQYSQALNKSPQDANLHFLLANNFNELRKLDQALVHYSQAFEFAKNDDLRIQALEKKANILLRLKKLDQAAEAAGQVLKIDSRNVAARNIFATFYLVQGKVVTDWVVGRVSGQEGA